MGQDALLVLTTCADRRAADRLATELVEARLAACVNVITGVSSTYRWQGKVERGDEVLLVIKSTARTYAALQRVLEDRSDYELPEVLAVSVTDGSQAYLDWLLRSVDGKEA